MRVLILTDAYPPEVRSSAHYMEDLACGLTAANHEVTVVTATPRYNLPDGCPGASDGGWIHETLEDGIRVIRVPTMRIHNVSLIRRGIGQFSLAAAALIGATRGESHDVAVVHSPPLTLALTAIALRFLARTPYLLSVQDMFPQNAIDLGVLTQRHVIAVFEQIEKWSYRYAARLLVQSRGHLPELGDRGARVHEIRILQNWVDMESYVDPDRARFRKLLGLDDAYVVAFTGVHGYAQGLETLIYSAHILREERDIRFLLVGDGVSKPALQRLAEELRLSNVIFADYVAREDYPDLIGAADAGLVILSKAMKTPVVPSKVFGYMAASIPVILSVNEESDTKEIIEASRAGIIVPPDDAASLAEAVLYLARHREDSDAMGVRGRVHVEAHYSRPRSLEAYERVIMECTGADR